MSTTANAPLLSSAQRPVPLRRRDDLVVKQIPFGDQESWTVKDPVALRYHRLLDEQYQVLLLLDGRRSLQEIRDALRRKLPLTRVTFADLQRTINELHRQGLVWSNRPGQGAALLRHARKERWKNVFSAVRNVFWIRLPGWDPERLLHALYPLLRWMFRPWFVWMSLSLVLTSWILLAVHFDAFLRGLPEFQQFFSWPNLLYLWLTIGMAKVLHELGHGLACKHFGGECHEIGIMLLVFAPCLYCDTSDSWMVTSKWRRMAIGAAGMYVELVLSALALWIWWTSEPGLVHHLALNVFLVTSLSTIIFNANPLLRFDGYYILSDWLEIPNLRAKAGKLLQNAFAWYCLGIEPPPDPLMPERGRGWLALYAVASLLYRWFIIFSIALFLFFMLKPYGMQNIGLGLALFSVATMVGLMVVNVYRIVTVPRIDPMDPRKIALSVALACALLAVIVWVPLPLHFQAPVFLQPEGIQHVFVAAPGRLNEVVVQPGDRVQKGQPLARLENPELEDRLRQLRMDEAVQQLQITALHAMEDAAGEYLAAQQLQGIRRQIAELREQLELLTPRAPCDGWVVAPAEVPQPDFDSRRERLTTWYGSPLEAKNQGCFLQAGTHLLSVAPSTKFEAVVLVRQQDRGDVRVGQRILIRLEHQPDRLVHGTVQQISDRYQQFVPRSLSNKSGGPLPTVTDSSGRERLASSVYEATVAIDEQADWYRTAMRGYARFSRRRTLGAWLWRTVRRTFHLL